MYMCTYDLNQLVGAELLVLDSQRDNYIRAGLFESTQNEIECADPYFVDNINIVKCENIKIQNENRKYDAMLIRLNNLVSDFFFYIR